MVAFKGGTGRGGGGGWAMPPSLFLKKRVCPSISNDTSTIME